MANNIRASTAADFSSILTVINRAAEAYRGVIPDECWHQPYMSDEQLESEIADGVAFSVISIDGTIRAVMGQQQRDRVVLIRHAYVAPEYQGQGLGDALLSHFSRQNIAPIMIGTWTDAHWAVRFYCNRGFRLLERQATVTLLRRYWRVPPRQIEHSVVLADDRAYDNIVTPLGAN